jgi:hypothetical protein
MSIVSLPVRSSEGKLPKVSFGVEGGGGIIRGHIGKSGGLLIVALYGNDGRRRGGGILIRHGVGVGDAVVGSRDR